MRTTSIIRFFSIILTMSVSTIRAADSCVAQTPVQSKNHFVLVIDRSGSMAGEPIEAARQGALNFVSGLKAGDECALIAFADTVELLSDLTADKSALLTQIRSISTGGQTLLNDAIAKAVSLVTRVDGAAVIVYLTDGVDTGSKFTLRDLESMNIVEGVLIYGFGYGSVDRDKLAALSEATGGTFNHTDSASRLTDIYSDVLNKYYESKDRTSAGYSKASIRSIPSNLGVILDGNTVGLTPLNIDQLRPGPHEVVINYPDGGKWQCSFDAKPSHRVVMLAHESDMGHSLRVSSNPKNASVFVDGAYFGLTSEKAVAREKRLFKQETIDFSRQLEIPYLRTGKHTLRIIAMPDFDFGGSQVFEFDFRMGSDSRAVEIDIHNRRSKFTNGEIIKGQRDPFEDLDSQFK